MDVRMNRPVSRSQLGLLTMTILTNACAVASLLFIYRLTHRGETCKISLIGLFSASYLGFCQWFPALRSKD